MQYPYSEYREGDNQAGQDNGAWEQESTDKVNSKPIQSNGRS